jgi:hypothetical protein
MDEIMEKAVTPASDIFIGRPSGEILPELVARVERLLLRT